MGNQINIVRRPSEPTGILPKVGEILYNKGYVVKCFTDPFLAYRLLSVDKNPSLTIIDTMLIGDFRGNGRFTEKNTKGGFKAGIVLLEELAAVNSYIYPQNAVLYTIVNKKDWSITAIDKAVEKYNVPVITDSYDAQEFAEKVEEIFANLDLQKV